MDLISIFALIVLIISIGTLIVGIAAYIAFKIRQSRGPRSKIHGSEQHVTELMFLTPYTFENRMQTLQKDAEICIDQVPDTVLSDDSNTLRK
jgi:heme/copper-type cytochrome/quinol oxidase subunit 2